MMLMEKVKVKMQKLKVKMWKVTVLQAEKFPLQ